MTIDIVSEVSQEMRPGEDGRYQSKGSYFWSLLQTIPAVSSRKSDDGNSPITDFVSANNGDNRLTNLGIIVFVSES